MKDSYVEIREPLLGGNGSSWNRYGLIALVGSLLLLLGVFMHDSKGFETSVSEPGQVWPSKFSNTEVLVGHYVGELTGNEGDEWIEELHKDFGVHIPKPDRWNPEGDEAAKEPWEMVHQGKYYKSLEECKDYQKQWPTRTIGKDMPCDCGLYMGDPWWYVGIKRYYTCTSKECTHLKNVEDCTKAPECEVRPAGGDKYWYCAKIEECYKETPNAAQLKDIKMLADERVKNGWDGKTFPIKRDASFFKKGNCVETCPWSEAFSLCMPSDLNRSWWLFNKLIDGEGKMVKAAINMQKLEEAVKKECGAKGDECVKKVKAFAEVMTDWYMVKMTGQCRVREAKAGNDNCPMGYSGCTTTTNAKVGKKGVCSDDKDWGWKCIWLQASPVMAGLGFSEAKEIKGWSETIENIMLVWDSMELGTDFKWDKAETIEQQELTEEKSLLLKAEKGHEAIAEIKEAMTLLRAAVTDEKKLNHILLYAEFTLQWTNAKHYYDLVNNLLAVTGFKSAVMLSHYKFGAAAADAAGKTAAKISAGLAKAAGVAIADPTGIVAAGVIAGLAAAAVGSNIAADLKTKENTILQCPAVTKRTGSDFTKVVADVKTAFS